MARERASRTAAKVAKGVVMLGEYPDMAPLLPAGVAASTAQLLRAAGVMGRFEAWLYRKGWFRSFASFMERRFVPGQALAGALRKRFFDDEVRAAITDGATQVVSVGGGLDNLCIRLADEFPHVTFVDTDAPATLAIKRRGVEALALGRPNLHLIDADLAHTPIGDVLASVEAWRANAPAVGVAEGVLMYLDATAVASFLAQMRALLGSRGRLLFTYMDADDTGLVSIGSHPRFMRWLFRRIGEPLRWGVRRDALARVLADHDLRLDAPAERYDLHQRYLVPANMAGRALAEIEHMGCAVARVAE